MSGARERTFVLLFFLLAGGKLDVDAQTAVNRTVHYTLCGLDCQNTDESLETIAANCTEGQEVYIDILASHVYLNSRISFYGSHSLTINGNPNSSTSIHCMQGNNRSDAGIRFENVSSLTLSNLILTNCGSLTRFNGTLSYISALTMLYCENMNIQNMAIVKSQGIGLTILHHQKGIVRIIGSNFTENKYEKHYHYIYGGGGVYIGTFHKWSSSPISFEFEHCIFANNVAYTRYYHSFYTDEFGVPRTGYGQGGGVFIDTTETIHDNMVVSFTNCLFWQNVAFLGSGLSVSIGKGNKPAIVKVKDSIFHSNGCDHHNTTNSSIGGGAYLGFKSKNTAGSQYILQNVTFTENCAEVGGGIYFYSHTQNSKNCSLLFDSCKFEGNKAHIGSAIDLTPYWLSTEHVNIVTVFKNCTFINNTVFVNYYQPHDPQRILGIGTIYSSLYDIKFEGKNHFESNRGTPVYMVNCIADFTRSSVTFKKNRGIRGGAIALIGTSSIKVGPMKEYLFMNNEAYYQGGAIFTQMIDTHDFTVSRSCFIQYFVGDQQVRNNSWNNNITFIGNKAPLGPAIFTTSLHTCQQINECRHYKTLNASNVFSSRGIHINEAKVATEGAQLQRKYTKLHMIPGKQNNHGVTIIDDTGNEVDEPLRANTVSRGNGVMLDPALSSYVGEKLQLRGKPGEMASLFLHAVSTRQTFTILEVELEDCPPGFKLEADRCVCNANEYFGFIDYCDNDKFQTYLTPGLWAGLISSQEIATGICPHSFCSYSQSNTDDDTIMPGIPLPLNSSDLDKTVCGKTRTGILCGSCRPGYVVHFHSPKYLCKLVAPNICKGGWFFYILSELVPVTMVFIIAIAFNISFTSGAVNGFILFSQVLLSLNIDASGILKFPNQKKITEGYQLIYGFLNLDFFTTETLSFCLWSSATALDMLAFKYFTIVYAFSLVMLVIWLMNKCGGRCFGKWCRITKVKSSLIHGISAFLIICYSQSILLSYSLLSIAEVQPREGSNTRISKRVWLDGNMTFLSRSHLPYALPALLFLFTIGIFPPILLLAYPLSNKALTLFGFEEAKLVTYISRKLRISYLKPLLDCFQSCFKDNLRFFAGLYFLYRWIAPVVHSISSCLGTAYITTEILLILILAIHAFCQPYTKRVYNMIDTVLFTDLLLINSITCIHYYLFQSRENQNTVNTKVARIAIIQAILIYLPFITMLACMLLFGLRRMYSSYYYKQYRNQSSRNITLSNSFMKLRARVNSKELLDDNESYFNEQELDDTSYNRFEDSGDKLEMY